MIELAAEGGDFGWKRSVEACAEYAFDNDVVTFFQTAFQFLCGYQFNMGQTVEAFAIGLSQRGEVFSE